MPSGNPLHKGTGFLHVVEELRRLPDVRRRVPKDLWHYLDETVLPSSWYPERHYALLLHALVSALDPREAGGAPWSHLGRLSARQDLARDSSSVTPPPGESGPPSRAGSGYYRQFVKSGPIDPGAFFLRVKKLWQLRHDTGSLEVTRLSLDPPRVKLRLDGFRFGEAGMAELQTAYVLEFGRLSGIAMHGRLTSSRATGTTEWEYTLEPGSAITAWPESLPDA